MLTTTLEALTDDELYPAHEEESVPQGDLHEFQCDYLSDVLRTRFPQWWVVADLCLYWDRLAPRLYQAADVAVIQAPTPNLRDRPQSCRLWSHGPVLFVVEVASESSRDADVTDKKDTYERGLRVPEYLFVDNERWTLRFWRATAGGEYQEVQPSEDRRLWSRELNLGFAFDEDGLVRAYTPEGAMLLTHQEEHDLRELETRRADEQARRAEEEARRAKEQARRAEEQARRAEEQMLRAEELELRLAAALEELRRARE